MKRDMGIIRKQLLDLEGVGPETFSKVIPLMGASGTYHVKLLLDSPLVEGQVLIGPHGDRLVIARMTDAGHEFTELIRPPEVWEEVQRRLKALGCSPVKLVEHLAIQILKRRDA